MNLHSNKWAVIVALISAMLFLSGPAFAQSNPNAKTNARSNRVVGVWDVDVLLTNCTTGATISTFSALHQYNLGGTGQVVPDGPPIFLSPHMAIWKHIEGNDYVQTIKMFRFDADGAVLGWTVISNDVTISEDGNDLIGSGVAKIYNPAGIKVAESCPSLIGTRFTGE